MVRERAKRVSSPAMQTPSALPSSAAASSIDATCRARLEARLEARLDPSPKSANAAQFVLSLPGTEYVVTLDARGTTSVVPGKKLTGVIEGRAQKFHRAHAGGEFIEPLEGHPRLVQGRIRAVDAAANRVLLQAVVPMWITLDAAQSARAFAVGDFVNFSMESGVTFAPIA
jgi:hypothetical protein